MYVRSNLRFFLHRRSMFVQGGRVVTAGSQSSDCINAGLRCSVLCLLPPYALVLPRPAPKPAARKSHARRWDIGRGRTRSLKASNTMPPPPPS